MKRLLSCLALLVLVCWLGGCAGQQAAKPSAASNPAPRGDSRLRSGDQLTIRLDSGVAAGPQAIETAIDENGDISLPLAGRIRAAGATPSELAERIQASYVPRFYVRCNATVLATIRFFYVGGEVRSPGRYNWTEDVTLLKAINTAGGCNDFANRRKVEIARGGTKQVYDLDDIRQHPERDVGIQPGDSLYVPRSIF